MGPGLAAYCDGARATVTVRADHHWSHVRRSHEATDAVRARWRRSSGGQAATGASRAGIRQHRRTGPRVVSTAAPVPETRDLDGEDARATLRTCGTWQLLQDAFIRLRVSD